MILRVMVVVGALTLASGCERERGDPRGDDAGSGFANPPQTELDAATRPVVVPDPVQPADGGATYPPVDSGLATPTPLGAALLPTRPPTKLPGPTPYYRLDLQRDANGSLQVRSITRATLMQQPLPALGAEYVAAGYSGTEVVSAVPFRFPSDGHDTSFVNGKRSHETFAVDAATASVFVDATRPLDRLELIDEMSRVLVTVAGAELPALQPSAVLPKNVGMIRQALGSDELAAAYPQIRFLVAGEDAQLSSGELHGRQLVTPSTAMNDSVAEALSRAAPLLLGAINRIGWAAWPKGSATEARNAAITLGSTIGATIFLNVEFAGDPTMIETVLHEAAHAFDFLTWVAADGPAGLVAWPEPIRQQALATVRDYRLVAGFRALWSDLHASGFQEGFTSPYVGTDTALEQLTDVDARNAGVASAYGMSSAGEDIAEYVGTVEAGSGTSPGICPLFVGRSQIVPAIAIPYAKLVLLFGAGAITEAGFNVCVAGARIDAPSGFAFPGPGISFSDAVRGGLATSGEEHFFRVLARGPNTYQILLEVPLESPEASPLGLHRLDDVWLATVANASQTGVYLAHDLPEKARAGASGLVLVTQSSTQHQEGALFGLQLQNGFGVPTDSWSFGTFAAP